MPLRSYILCFFLLLGLFSKGVAQFILPDRFTHEGVIWGQEGLNGMLFEDNGRLYVWQKKGIVLIYENGALRPEPLIDIHDEVGSWRDHGLLGMALHPNFRDNGYFYLFYAVDRHHLMNAGTPNYDPDKNEYFEATIGRITRYTADPATDFTTVLPDSRKVLIGATPQTGMPILHESHAIGSLFFGTDGSLLASMGDGASFINTDVGGEEHGAYVNQALADGILKPKEDIGGWRSQLIDSYNGKILRIDPETGEGISSNPFFDPAAPDAPRSKVWALGLRNPFRSSLVDGTGSHNMDDGDPGVIVMGDVGWWNWEELNIAPKGGMNFGWPRFEGIELLTWAFERHPTANLDAPNPLYTEEGCDEPYFRFQDLLVQARGDSAYEFPNPCAPTQSVPANVPHFVHTPPAIDWANSLREEIVARAPFYPEEGEIEPRELADVTSPVSGPNFEGASATGGTYYGADVFPEEYRGTYFFADYTHRWIKNIQLDSESRPVAVYDFATTTHNITDLKVNPADGCLYYLAYPGSVRRICYGGNVAPVARIDVDTLYGPSPLTVEFSAENSSDYNNDSLSYFWELGDGSTQTAETFSHTFTVEDGLPASFTVKMTATDTAGASQTSQQVISVNNTPPSVRITSIPEDFTYSVTQSMDWPLEAEVIDLEHSEDQLSYQWQTILYHNTHTHPEGFLTEKSGTTFLTAVGCDEIETHYFKILLEVIDAEGLVGRDERILLPDCTPATEWGELTSEAGGETVRLEWSTNFEVNTDRFEIERSLDEGETFEVIGQLAASGDSPSPQAYVFEDNAPQEGETVYRVKLYEEFGKYEYSGLAQVRWLSYGKIGLAPNPATDELEVTFNHIEGEAGLILMDRVGRVVWKGTWVEIETGTHKIQLPRLSTGLYHYHTYNGIQTQTGLLRIE